MDLCRSWFLNVNYTELLQIIAAFALGIVFSPWSWGPIFLILYIVLYEFLFGLCAKWRPPFWNLPTRVAIIYATLMGWFIGSVLIGYDDPFEDRDTNERVVVINKDQVKINN